MWPINKILLILRSIMIKRTIFIVVAAAMTMSLLGCSIKSTAVVYEEKEPEAVAEQFVGALQSGLSDKAYDLFTPQRQQAKTKEQFAQSAAALASTRPKGIASYRVVGSKFVAPKPLTVDVTVEFVNSNSPEKRIFNVFVTKTVDGWRVNNNI